MSPRHTIHTYCEFHLGDNLFHLHFLRKLAEMNPSIRFCHAAHDCHIPQMRDLVEDVAAISLVPIECRDREALNAWKNTDNFFGGMDQSPDYYEFYLRWFDRLARQMGLASPFSRMSDLLFDYPKLKRPVKCGLTFDTLVVNSQPCSGQWMAYDGNEAQRKVLEDIIAEMALKQRVVVTQTVPGTGIPCTRDMGLTVTGIGNLSLRCRNVVMIGTGPAWPTCNAFNLDRIEKRIVLMEPERVNFKPGIRHARDFADLRTVLREEGLL